MSTYSLASDLDFTRHVRTEAGVKRYGKPIGSPIGGGSKGSEAASDMTHLASTLGASIAKSLGDGKSSGSKHPGASMRASSRQTKPSFAEHRSAAKSVSTGTQRRTKTSPGSGDDKSNLYQLTPEKMQQAIDDPNTPKDRKNAMRVIQAQRKATAAKILGEKPKLKEYAKEHEDEYKNNPNKFFQGLYKIAPWLKPHMEVIRKGKTGQDAKTLKKKGADHLIDVAIEIIAKAALTGLAIHLGLGAG